MAKRKLSQSAENRRRRARYAEARAKKLRRAEAARKGWLTRLNKTLRATTETARATPPSEAEILEQKNRALNKKLKEITEKLEKTKTALAASHAELERNAPEMALIKQGKQELRELYFREETEDERKNRMNLYWHESAALVSGAGISRYGQLLLWIQRNGFQQAEFWAEYRRRQR